MKKHLETHIFCKFKLIRDILLGCTPEGSHHLIVGKILVVVFMDGVATRLGVGPTGVLVPIETQL